LSVPVCCCRVLYYAVACFIYFFISLGFHAVARDLGHNLEPGFGPKWSLTSEHAHAHRTGRWSWAWAPRPRDPEFPNWKTICPNSPASQFPNPHWRPQPLLTMLPRVRSINMLRYQRNLSSYKQQRARRG